MTNYVRVWYALERGAIPAHLPRNGVWTRAEHFFAKEGSLVLVESKGYREARTLVTAASVNFVDSRDSEPEGETAERWPRPTTENRED